jgi:glucosylceramidase
VIHRSMLCLSFFCALWFGDARPSAAADLTPFTTPAPVPGTLGAETFDNGGEGVAYHDTTPGNSGGAFRDTDVDIEVSSEGGYDVGWTAPGEWLNYTVNVAAAGSYTVQFRVASPDSGNAIHVGFNTASSVWSTVAIPATGGWQSWTNVTVPVTLGAGVQQMTLLFDTGGINLSTISIAGTQGPPPGSSVDIWVTTPDGLQRLAQQQALSFVPGDQGSGIPAIDVADGVRYQQIEGFGGSITDSSASVLAGLGPDDQRSIMMALFDPASGIGLGFLRQPIGGSDFAQTQYTYDDIDPAGTDYDLVNFSIDHDRPSILPALRGALAVNPAIRVMGTPWSAPAWMKTTRTITDGGNLRPDAFAAYASYFVKFIQAYQAEGVPIDSLTVQNEPATAPPYPSMVMTSDDQAAFIGQYLGPALAAAGLQPRIFTWDHNWDPTFALNVLGNPAAAAYISGVAFHCYLGQPESMSTVHDSFPAQTIAVTECGDGSRATFGDKLMFDVRTLLIASMRNWARTVTKWNLVLDETGGPKLYPGSCVHCTGLVTVDRASGAISFNEDYYALGHASRFIQRGAYRVDSTAFGLGGIENVAFSNPDGSFVLLAVNSGDGPLTFQIRWRGASVPYTLESGAVATFRWAP